MPVYIITLADDATDAEYKAVKDQVVKNGGTIDHEYTLIKGFSCNLPEIHAASFADHPKVKGVEQDQIVTIQ